MEETFHAVLRNAILGKYAYISYHHLIQICPSTLVLLSAERNEW